jgi:hypothetical protein
VIGLSYSYFSLILNIFVILNKKFQISSLHSLKDVNN